MLSGFKKLITSNGTLVLLAIIAVPYLLYSLWNSAPAQGWTKPTKGTKTIEEIINTPIPNIKADGFDPDFKSTITPLEDTK